MRGLFLGWRLRVLLFPLNAMFFGGCKGRGGGTEGPRRGCVGDEGRQRGVSNVEEG